MSAALFGTIAGSISSGLIGDRLDRRHTLLLSCLLYSLASLGVALSFHFILFALFRFAGGVAIGLISVAAPMYLAEIALSHLRGRIVGTFQLSVSGGVVLGFALGYLLSMSPLLHGSAWRYSFGSGALLALLSAGMILQASPSPRWLARKRRFIEAASVLKALGSENSDSDRANLAASIEESISADHSSLFSRIYVRPLLLAASVAIFNQLTGVNVLLYYILDVFRDLGSGRLNGGKDAVLVSTLSLLVTALAVGLIDKVGRKPLLLVGTVGLALCLALLSAIHSFHWPAATVPIVLVCYNACFAFSQGTVIWVYLSEIFPVAVRTRGQSWGSSVHWVMNAFIIGVFPSFSHDLGEGIFLILSGVMAIQFFVILFVYPETRRVSLESL
jgi:sugar porter (SP) family MFS transporter